MQEDLLQKTLCCGNDDSNRFHLFVSLSEFYSKNGDYEKEKNCLNEALKLREHDIIVNYRLAVAFERDGLASDAIERYNAALKDQDGLSPQLRRYIRSQISRVEASGPRKKPPMPGLRWVTW